MLRELSRFCTDRINAADADDDITGELWNRVAEKTQKIAGLLAVSDNQTNPRISVHHLHWAASLAITDANRLLKKFQLGEIGDDRTPRQEAALRRIALWWLSPEGLASKGAIPKLQEHSVIPYFIFQQNVTRDAAFKPTMKGQSSTDVFKKALQNFVDTGKLNAVNHNQVAKIRGRSCSGKYYQISKEHKGFWGLSRFFPEDDK